MTKIVFAQSNLAVGLDGMPLTLFAGDPWDANDPLVQARPDLFGDSPPEKSIRRTVRPPMEVEQATQAPGERRNVRRA